jgi:hypothetical protein
MRLEIPLQYEETRCIIRYGALVGRVCPSRRNSIHRASAGRTKHCHPGDPYSGADCGDPCGPPERGSLCGVLYVNDAGVIVTAPTTVTTTTTEAVEQEVITYEQVQQDLPRYQLIKKEHDKEIYLDRQTGKKVKIERKD